MKKVTLRLLVSLIASVLLHYILAFILTHIITGYVSAAIQIALGYHEIIYGTSQEAWYVMIRNTMLFTILIFLMISLVAFVRKKNRPLRK